MYLKFHSFNLELRETFTTSHGSRNVQPSLIVEVNDGEYSGFGEAAATSYYGVSIEKMKTSLNSVRNIVLENLHLKPEEIWELTFPQLENNTFAQCALDMALHDLYGKKQGLPLYKLWGLQLKEIPLTNYTIGIDSIERMIEKMKAFPWPVYKIKLGTEGDVQIVRELRKHTEAVFRLDANAGWKAEQAIKNSKALKPLGVEFLEQPLHPKDIEGMRLLYKESALPLIADESCMIEEDIEKCADNFHGVNIKLTKCGGLTPAKRMVMRARKLNLKVMVGCMTESTVGISAIAHLLPLLDYVDMDGALLLKNDIASGVNIYNKKVHFPKRNGTGAELINLDRN
jgi:L-alanine-DL-glutamate epimerase-like enolase superfamily enzyme